MASALSLTTSNPLRPPEEVGAKETLMAQLAPAFRDMPQPVLKVKSPVGEIELIVIGAVPTFLNVMVCGALIVVTT